jgi:hypothetical protein
MKMRELTESKPVLSKISSRGMHVDVLRVDLKLQG